MKTIDLIKKLQEIGKEKYTLSDLKKITGLEGVYLNVKINRLLKRNILKKITRNVYILEYQSVNTEKIANELVRPSYLSCDSALSKYGIISEIPYTLEFVTVKKSRKRIVNQIEVNYRRIKENLFFGYVFDGNIFIAEKEKAFLDKIYFTVFGKDFIDKRKIDLFKLDKDKISSFLSQYPEKVKNFIKLNFFNI